MRSTVSILACDQDHRLNKYYAGFDTFIHYLLCPECDAEIIAALEDQPRIDKDEAWSPELNYKSHEGRTRYIKKKLGIGTLAVQERTAGALLVELVTTQAEIATIENALTGVAEIASAMSPESRGHLLKTVELEGTRLFNAMQRVKELKRSLPR